MKIVLLSHSASFLGAERSLIETVQGLTEAGIDCHVFLPAGAPVAEPWRGLPRPHSVTSVAGWTAGHRSLSIRDRLSAVRSTVSTARQFAARLKAIRPDLVITNTLVTPTAALAAKLLGIPHIWCIREFGVRDHNIYFHWGRRISLFLIDRLSTRIVVNSAAVAEHFSGALSEEKMSVVHNAVQTGSAMRLNGDADGTFRLVLVGAISPGKRQEDAIRAVSALRLRGVEMLLSIVGPACDEAYSRYLVDLVRDLRVGDIVEFAGATNDPAACFAAADLSLMCSKDEAFGRVTVEAMKAGTPVIGAMSGGTVEIIRHGFNGLLYPPGDVEALVEQLWHAYHDPQLVRTMAENAYGWAHETFNLGKYTRELLVVCDQALTAGRRGVRGA